MRLSVFAVAALLSASVAAHADTASVSLASVSSDTFTYDLDIPSSGEFQVHGQTIELTGLSGVTGASLIGGSMYTDTLAFTPTSVTVTASGNNTYTSGDYPLLALTSTASVGSAGYEINTFVNVNPGTYQTFSGTVEGPTGTAVTPEPSSIALLGTGLLGVTGVLRKRFAKTV